MNIIAGRHTIEIYMGKKTHIILLTIIEVLVVKLSIQIFRPHTSMELAFFQKHHIIQTMTL